MLNDCIRQVGFDKAFNVRHATLVSAKTGYGIEDLVTKLLHDWGKQGMMEEMFYI